MAAQITAALVTLLITWLSIHKIRRTKRTIAIILWSLVGILCFLSWTGNAWPTIGVAGWLIGTVVIVAIEFGVKRDAVKK